MHGCHFGTHYAAEPSSSWYTYKEMETNMLGIGKGKKKKKWTMQALVTCASCVVLALIQNSVHRQLFIPQLFSITRGFGCLGCYFVYWLHGTNTTMIWFIRGVSGHILSVLANFFFYPPTTKPTNTFCVDFQSSIYFPSSTSVHPNFTYYIVTWPSWIYQINITSKPPNTIFSSWFVSCFL